MKFTEYKGLDLVATGNEVLDRWKKNHAFEKSLELREGAPEFIFFEGPPSANGMPGIHHVMARSIKDAICRFKTQSGYKVNRRAGWDTHGLPVELGVEKMLAITWWMPGIPLAEGGPSKNMNSGAPVSYTHLTLPTNVNV